jgi:probable rRNA maturation factor
LRTEPPRNIHLTSRDRQYGRLVELGLLRRLLKFLVKESGFKGELHVCLVTARKITRLNEEFLRHNGPTDVITFDYSQDRKEDCQGEIFICLAQAFSQARSFQTNWQSELVRYVVHGVLHLVGYDDRSASKRTRMKRVEDRIVRRLSKCFDLSALARD